MGANHVKLISTRECFLLFVVALFDYQNPVGYLTIYEGKFSSKMFSFCSDFWQKRCAVQEKYIGLSAMAYLKNML